MTETYLRVAEKFNMNILAFVAVAGALFVAAEAQGKKVAPQAKLIF